MHVRTRFVASQYPTLFTSLVNDDYSFWKSKQIKWCVAPVYYYFFNTIIEHIKWKDRCIYLTPRSPLIFKWKNFLPHHKYYIINEARDLAEAELDII